MADGERETTGLSDDDKAEVMRKTREKMRADAIKRAEAAEKPAPKVAAADVAAVAPAAPAEPTKAPLSQKALTPWIERKGLELRCLNCGKTETLMDQQQAGAMAPAGLEARRLEATKRFTAVHAEHTDATPAAAAAYKKELSERQKGKTPATT